MASMGARAYNWGLGHSPSGGPGGRAPGGGGGARHEADGIYYRSTHFGSVLEPDVTHMVHITLAVDSCCIRYEMLF